MLGRIALADDWRPFWMTGLIVLTLVIFGRLFFGFRMVDFLFNIMLLIGIVLVSRVFNDTHEQEKGIYFFMLPASIEEKYLIKLISTLIGYFLFALLVCIAGGLVSDFIGSFIYDSMEFRLHNPMSSQPMDKFAIYIFFHALYFTGSLYFKKNGFFKTSFIIIVITIIILIIAGTYVKHIMVSGHNRQYYFDIDSGVMHLRNVLGLSADQYFMYTKVLFSGILPVVLFILSYFKFKRSEIKG